MFKGRIIKNAAKCLVCGDEIESKHRHDFVSCKCGKISIDGGLDYCKWSGDLSDIKNLSEFEELDEVEILAGLYKKLSPDETMALDYLDGINNGGTLQDLRRYHYSWKDNNR